MGDGVRIEPVLFGSGQSLDPVMFLPWLRDLKKDFLYCQLDIRALNVIKRIEWRMTALSLSPCLMNLHIL